MQVNKDMDVAFLTDGWLPSKINNAKHSGFFFFFLMKFKCSASLMLSTALPARLLRTFISVGASLVQIPVSITASKARTCCWKVVDEFPYKYQASWGRCVGGRAEWLAGKTAVLLSSNRVGIRMFEWQQVQPPFSFHSFSIWVTKASVYMQRSAERRKSCWVQHLMELHGNNYWLANADSLADHFRNVLQRVCVSSEMWGVTIERNRE